VNSGGAEKLISLPNFLIWWCIITILFYNNGVIFIVLEYMDGGAD